MIQDLKNFWVVFVVVDLIDIGCVQVCYVYQKLNGDEIEDQVVFNFVYVQCEVLFEK